MDIPYNLTKENMELVTNGLAEVIIATNDHARKIGAATGEIGVIQAFLLTCAQYTLTKSCQLSPTAARERDLANMTEEVLEQAHRLGGSLGTYAAWKESL